MRKLSRVLALFISLALLCPVTVLKAQEVLSSDAGLVAPYGTADAVLNTTLYRTTTAAAPFPFFDDFSHDSLQPATDLWEFDSTSTPAIGRFKAVNPPSKGVCTFDGITFRGEMYSSVFSYGIADSLVSHSIDLSGFSVGDSLYLSFFIEPRGYGEGPEFLDSFVVSFDTIPDSDTTGGRRYVQVYAVGGDELPTSRFTPVLIPLNDPSYFRENFRMRFHGLGSLNGALDQWHLDYVYLDQNRSHDDSLFTDGSATMMPVPLMGDYTALPWREFTAGGFMSTPWAGLRNLGSASRSFNLQTQITNPDGAWSLTGTTTANASPSVPANDYMDVSLSLYTDQGSIVNGPGTLRYTLLAESSGDSRPENDTLWFDYPLEYSFGYDDAEADIGYGLTTSRAFCQEFTQSAPDTLTAISFKFVPTLHYNSTTNQSTNMEGRSFRISVWQQLIPDSFMVQIGANINSGALGEYVRYELNTPIVIDSLTFWVGIKQTDNKPVGLGLDRNYDNKSRIYYQNSANEFQQTTQTGTLMIRPEFTDSTVLVSRPHVQTPVPMPDMDLWPNPTNGPLNLRFREEVTRAEWSLVDLQGRILSHGAFSGAEATVPAGIPAGLYLLRVEGEREGNPFRIHHKVIIGR